MIYKMILAHIYSLLSYQRELHNLYSSIESEAQAWTQAKTKIEDRPFSPITKGLIYFVEKKLKENKKWKQKSLFAFELIQADPPIKEFEREEAHSPSIFSPVGEDDLLLVEEGQISDSENSDNEEDDF